MGRCRKGKKQENIEGLECRRNVFGRGYFSFFAEKWGDFDGGEDNSKHGDNVQDADFEEVK